MQTRPRLPGRRPKGLAGSSPAAGPNTVTSTIEFFDQPTPGFTWTICGWRGLATANAARRGKLRARLSLLKRDGETWRTLLAVASQPLARSALTGLLVPPFRPCAISYRLTIAEWHVWPDRARDPMGVAESAKRGVDSLVVAGWLAGDGPEHMRELVVRPIVMAVGTPSPGVRLTVEALA